MSTPDVKPIGYALYGNIDYADGSRDKHDHFGIRCLVIGFEILEPGRIRYFFSNGMWADNDSNARPQVWSVHGLSPDRWSPNYRSIGC